MPVAAKNQAGDGMWPVQEMIHFAMNGALPPKSAGGTLQEMAIRWPEPERATGRT